MSKMLQERLTKLIEAVESLAHSVKYSRCQYTYSQSGSLERITYHVYRNVGIRDKQVVQACDCGSVRTLEITKYG